MNHRNIVESWMALRETLYPSSSFHLSPPSLPLLPPPSLLFFQRTIPKGWLISRRLLVLAASAYCSAFPRISSSSYAAHEMEHEADVAPRQSFPLSSSSLLLTFLRSYNKTGTLVYLISRLPFHDEPRDRFIHPPPCRRDYPCSSCFETSGLVHFYSMRFSLRWMNFDFELIYLRINLFNKGERGWKKWIYVVKERIRVGCIIPRKNWKGIKRNEKVWTLTLGR